MHMDGKYLSVVSGVVENGHLYTVDLDTWFFIDCDLKMNTYRVIADIQPKQESKICWVEKILHIETEFFLIIRNAKLLISINEYGEVNYFGERNVFGADDCELYMDACVIDKRLYMLPGTFDGLITVFDLENHCFIEDIPLLDIVNYHEEPVQSNWILSYIHNESDDKVRFCILDTNLFCTLDLKGLDADLITYDENVEFQQVAGDWSNTIVMEKSSYRIFLYDSSVNCLKQMGDVKGHNDSDVDWIGYQHIYTARDCIMAIPAQMDTLEKLDREGRVIEILDMPQESELCFDVRYCKDKFGYPVQTDDTLYLLPFSTNGLVEVDIHTFEMTFHPLSISGMDLLAKKMKIKAKPAIIKENEKISLEEYIYMLSSPI